ncbi:MAG: IgGFc-binding protein, partial [Dokdonia sp.]
MKIKYILPVLFLLLFTTDALAQLGSTHYFPPMHARFTNNVDAHRMYFSTPFGDNALPENRIRVELTDGNGNAVFDNAGNVIAPFFIWNGQPAFRDIRIAGTGGATDLLVTGGELNTPLRNRGIIVTATAEIYVSVRMEDGNHAGYLTGKGSNALGRDFRIGHMPMVEVANNRNFFAGVMAIEDNTVVTFSEYDNTVNFSGLGVQPGGFSRTLDAGETLVVSGYAQDAAINMTGFIGARITSNNDIVVNTGNLLGNTIANGGLGNDMGIDQIVPVDLVGTEYLMVPGNGIGGTTQDIEVPLIIATVANTTISVNGGAPIATLANPGDYFEIPPTNYIGVDHEHMYIETSAPAYAYQVVAGSNTNGATPGMNFIPPLSCFFQRDVNLIPDVEIVANLGGATYSGSIIVLAEPGQPVRINGVLTTAVAEPAIGTPDWVSYKIPILAGGNVAIDSDGPIAAGLIGTSNNAAIAGYYSGFAVTPTDTTTDVCTLDGPINLVDRIDGNPAGTGSFTPPLSGGGLIFDPALDPPGTYVYSEVGVCENVVVDVTVNLVDNPVIDPIADVTRCEGDSYTLPDPSTIAGSNLNNPQYYTDLQASGMATLIDWTIPFTTVGSQRIYVYDENPANPFACEAELFFNITINATPAATVTDPVVCEGEVTFPITLNQTAGGTLDNYQIDFDPAAETAGFTDVAVFTALGGANFDIPVGVAPGVYNGVITYQDVVAPGLSCTGTDAFTITVNANPVATTNDVQVCQGITSEAIVLTPSVGTPTGYWIDYDPTAEAQGFTDVGTA